MPSLSLRLQLIALGLAGLAVAVLITASAAWLAPDALSSSDDGGWLAGLCILATVAVPVVLASILAKRIALAVAQVEAVARALVGGARLEAPAKVEWSEMAAACDRLARAAAVARSREATLRATDRAKDEFLAMLGHELRNPLGVLAAASHVLHKSAPDNDAVLGAAAVITRQVHHMTRLVEDLLDVSRVTRGKVSLNRQPLNFAHAVGKAVNELRLAGRLDRHDLRLDLTEVWVRADEARIEQVATNLIGNAVKYTPEGGSIEVTLRRDRNAAVLRVRDTGIGMSAELVSHVFDVFVQGEEAGKQAGLGIGLTLVKHLAELHGGKAFAASAGPGQGSVFTVSLPTVEAQALQTTQASTAAQACHRILLVEDNVDARNTMLAALQLDGHRVYEAVDGETGIRAAATVKPDVAIIDIGLPGRDGYEVASALRQTPERQQMVLIAVTGYEQPDSWRRAREAGFDEYVTKPIAPDRLVRLIDAAFAARARRQAALANRSS
jgi:signal transduction histidine kinase/CheY-like chemotaxis protein